MLWLLFRLISNDGTDESSLLPDLRPRAAATAAATALSSLYPLGWRGGVGGSFDEVFLGREVGDDDGGAVVAVAREVRAEVGCRRDSLGEDSRRACG